MRLLKRLLTVIVLALLLVLAILVVRTVRLESRFAALPDVRTLPAAPPFDVAVAARHLGEAVRFQTVSHQDPAEDDAAEWNRLHDWLATSYPATHAALRRELIDGRTLIYTWPGHKPSLAPVVLMAHQDVVPVAPGSESGWHHPPFGGELADGAVWGRGAVDDKGSLVSIFEALEALLRNGFNPERTLIVISGANEEVHGSGARAAAAAMLARGIHAEFVLDEGLLVLARHPVTGGPVALVGVAEKGYATLTLTARAAGGHSSMPPPESAVRTLATAIERVTGAEAPMSLAGPTREMLEALAPSAPLLARVAIANEWLLGPALIDKMRATPAGAAMLHTTMALTMLSGSPKENVLPERASVTINYRLLPGDASAAVEARARRTVAGLPVDVAIQGTPLEASVVSSTSSRGWSLIAALAADVARSPVAPGLMIGGTDARALQAVAADVYRFQPIVLAAADLAMLHGTDERMTTANLESAIAFYARLIEAATR